MKRKIFLTDQDRNDFLSHLTDLVEEKWMEWVR